MKNIIYLFLLLNISCTPIINKTVKTSSSSYLNKQNSSASTIQLQYGETIIHLSDYIEDLSHPINILSSNELNVVYNDVNKTLSITPKLSMPLLSLLTIKTSKENIDLLVKKSTKIKYQMRLSDTDRQYKTVGIKGEFNAWNPSNSPMAYTNGAWHCDIFIKPDNYAYQFVVDGEEKLDPNNPIKISNGMGGWNSQLKLKKDNQNIPQLSTKSFSNKTIYLTKNNTSEKIIALWQNKKLNFQINDNKVLITIPENAFSIKRSEIRVWAYNNNAASRELYIPLKWGIPITSAKQLDRSDKETNIMYYTMIDRFSDANSSNNYPLNDSEVDIKADFHGGDLAGIKDKIESGYFQDLGITALWLSPIVQNPEGKFGFFNKKDIKSKFSSYHGYWPISFTKIDYRYGTSQDLKNIVSVAHKNDMNVYLDFVANHVHEQHPVYQKHKDWATNLYLPDGSLNTEKWDDHRLTTWFDVFLPTLDLAKQEVTEMLSDSAMYWINKYDIDGFRHDATKHIPLNFWRTLTSKTKAYTRKTGKTIYQVGETYGTPTLINSYINSGMLDGQFDFNVYDALLGSICKDDTGFEQFEERINQSFNYYGVHNLMGYMSGNQDKPRFMSMATGDVKFDEDSKYAGWSRDIHKKTKLGYQKLAIMHAFLFTLPGIPVIYYGDEIGLAGGNDPDNRRDMKFENLTDLEINLRNQVSTLAKLRRNNPVFLFGDMQFHLVSKDQIVYSRNYFGKSINVIINNSDKVMMWKSTKVAARSFEILE